MNIPGELVEQLKSGNVVLFIGPSISSQAGVANLHSVAQKVISLIENCPSLLSDREALEYYEMLYGRHALIHLFRDEMTSSLARPTPAHHALARLPVNQIYTTNYDDLLEQTLAKSNRQFSQIVRSQDVNFWNVNKVQLIKLFGDFSQPETLTVTLTDIQAAFLRRTSITNLLSVMFQIQTFLFLGYRPDDPDFHQLQQFLLQVRSDSHYAKTVFSVMFDVNQFVVKQLKQHGIEVINFEVHRGPNQPSLRILQEQNRLLTEWLDTLYRHMRQPIRRNGHTWAVFVGVNKYEDEINYGELRVCANDAKDILEALKKGGFDEDRTRLLTEDFGESPTRDNVLVALKAIADATEPDDLLLFYYSGHGDIFKGESFLVARNGRHLILRDTAISVTRIKEIMQEASARAKVVVLDACHSGANIGNKSSRRMSNEFIEHVFEHAEGLAILASCQQGQLSYEWPKQNRSVFTKYLLDALKGEADIDDKGAVTVQDAHRFVVNKVRIWAAQRNVSQTPTLQYSVSGDIILSINN
ncbi:MAG: caspase family protein [Anaerolineaceae bacterium]|nr:caspase family protein [Anaerolineaceae bacterium]